MTAFLLEPLQYPFMRAGLAAAVLAGVACGLLGSYVVLRRVAYIGHALTHSALPGLALAHRHGVSLPLGAMAANLLTALGIGWFSRREETHEDTAIGVLSAAMFAAGIVLMARAGSFRDLTGLLFGQVLGVTGADLALMAAATAAVAGALALFHKEWMLATLDPGHARLVGLPVGALRMGFLFLLVLGVGASVQTVGAALAGALLVAPAAAARLLCRRLPGMMALSAALAAGCGACGLYLSYHLSLPSGASIALLCVAVYAAVHGAVGAAEAWRAAPPLTRTLAAALALNAAVIVVETAGGAHAHSLSLWLDVAHNLADEVGLLLLYAAHRSGGPARGLKRGAVLLIAAGLTAILLMLAAAALRRLAHPVEVHGGVTLLCGLLAAAGNGGVAWLLKGPGRADPALHLAHVHNVGDALLSFVPAAAGGLVLLTGRPWADAGLALAVACVLIVPSWRALAAAWRGRPHE